MVENEGQLFFLLCYPVPERSSELLGKHAVQDYAATKFWQTLSFIYRYCVLGSQQITYFLANL